MRFCSGYFHFSNTGLHQPITKDDSASKERPLRTFAVMIILVLGGLFLNCTLPSPDPEPSELEEEVVTLGPESRIDPDQDQKAVVYESEEGGMMPGTFPTDFPLLEPSTVINFGEEEGGLFAVSRVQLSSNTVRERFQRMASAHGWKEIPGETSGQLHFEKDGRSIQLTLSDSSPGTDVLFRW